MNDKGIAKILVAVKGLFFVYCVMMVNDEPKEPDYEKAELDLLRESLKKSYEERFFAMTKFMKRNIMLRNAKVVHQPLSASSKK